MTRARRFFALTPLLALAAPLSLAGGVAALESLPRVQAYFNHNPNARFREPYRGILRSGDDFEEIVLQALGKAQKRIWIAVHEFRLPRIAERIAQKQAEGVDVRVILENEYSAPFAFRSRREMDALPEVEASRNRDYFYYIDQNHDEKLSQDELDHRDVPTLLLRRGIPVIDDTANGSKGSALMHHKFVIIDDADLVVTSANFTWSDFYGDFLNQNTRGNANHLVTLHQPELVKAFEKEFLEMWSQKKFGPQKMARPKFRFSVNAKNDAWVQFAPNTAKTPWNKTALGSVVETLASARSSIDIAQFVFSEQKITNALETWVEGGKRALRVLVDKQFIYQDYSEALDIFGLKLLNRHCRYEEGNRPWTDAQPESVGTPRLQPGDKFHHKFAVVDEEWVLFGSLNWSESGNFQNDETVVAIQDPALAQAFGREYSRVYQAAQRGIPDWLPERITQQEEKCR